MTWALFDLDNTLYPKGTGVMEMVSQRISEYMAQRLDFDAATIKTLRPRYFETYGTTMRGLVVEFGIDAEDYLTYVHGFQAERFLSRSDELERVLGQLPWHKVVFTSSPGEHARQVLSALGVEQHFERIFDIRSTGYVCKPDDSAYRFVLKELQAQPEQCLVLDDSLANLRAASALGMLTVWVGSDKSEEGTDWAIPRIEQVLSLVPNRAVPHDRRPSGDRRAESV